ncbi:hypothetical protein HOE425_280002 [Hoeflea sp. EC-HK425]|nr:hypothetical protein HOE425_280002 [Hoeflea sp. EC-HK425]
MARLFTHAFEINILIVPCSIPAEGEKRTRPQGARLFPVPIAS